MKTAKIESIRILVVMTWAELLRNRRALLVATLTLIALLASLYSYTTFLHWVELRPGFAFVDPIHSLFKPVDLSWPVFIILYAAIITIFATFGRNPEHLFVLMRGYTFLIALRMISMALLPLDPPATMIPLVDPIVQAAAGNGSSPLSRDLFFSGHTSFLCLVALYAPYKPLKILFFALTILVGISVIVQHVHYSVDVLIAPMAAWFAYSLTKTTL